MLQLGEIVTYEGQWRGFWISPFIVLGLVKILHKILYLRLLIKGRIYPVQKLDVLKQKKKKKCIPHFRRENRENSRDKEIVLVTNNSYSHIYCGSQCETRKGVLRTVICTALSIGLCCHSLHAKVLSGANKKVFFCCFTYICIYVQMQVQ